MTVYDLREGRGREDGLAARLPEVSALARLSGIQMRYEAMKRNGQA